MTSSAQPAGKSWKDLPNDWCVNVKDNGGSFKVIYTSPDGAVLPLPPQCSAPRTPPLSSGDPPALRNNHWVGGEITYPKPALCPLSRTILSPSCAP